MLFCITKDHLFVIAKILFLSRIKCSDEMGLGYIHYSGSTYPPCQFLSTCNNKEKSNNTMDKSL